jgi:branched-chain amino acid transport system ATP-binding protein
MLKVETLDVSYGDAVALMNVNLYVERGTIVTLIGSNGAGKTTLVNTIAGMLRPKQGKILLEGNDLGVLPPHKVCEYGIAIVPEGRRLFTNLTVLDNLKLGAYSRHARQKAMQKLEEVYVLFPRLAERRTQIAGTLSGGEQQMVAIGRALLANPKLLLLDEPSLGLAPIVVSEIFKTIQLINKNSGVTILLVEQNANKALTISDKGYILQNGHIVKEGTSSELMTDVSVKNAYLGIGN